MDAMKLAWAWVEAHPVAFGFALYVLLNLAKRIPEPSNPDSFQHVAWEVFERFMVTAYDRWGGPFKMLLAAPKSGEEK